MEGIIKSVTKEKDLKSWLKDCFKRMQVLSKKGTIEVMLPFLEKNDRPTDQPTNQPTDQPIDGHKGS